MFYMKKIVHNVYLIHCCAPITIWIYNLGVVSWITLMTYMGMGGWEGSVVHFIVLHKSTQDMWFAHNYIYVILGKTLQINSFIKQQ